MNKLIIAVALSMIAGQVFATSNDHGKPNFENGHDNRPEKPAKPEKPAHPINTGAIGVGVGGAATSVSTVSTGPVTVNVQNTATTKAGKGGKGGKSSGGKGGNGEAGGSDNGYAGLPGGAGFLLTPQPVFVNPDYSGMPQQAPAMGNSYISTSNTCDGASSLGVVFPGGGVNFSSTALRMMCEGRLNSQAHKALGDEDKARRVMRVVDEYACTQDATWAKIAREEGVCKPDTAPAATETNPAFNSK